MENSFKEKFIAFIDILGSTNMVEAAERGVGPSINEIESYRAALGTPEDVEAFRRYGPTTCPESQFLQRDLDFQICQISDCAIVSAEISPAGVINLITHCWGAAMHLLTKGIMVRGYVTRGTILHDGQRIMGSGYHKAYNKEREVTAFKLEADERGTPFIELDSTVCDFVNKNTDHCVSEMFSRMVHSDEAVHAIFPFKVLSHSFIIGGFGVKFDPEREKRNNQSMRQGIHTIKERIMSHVSESNAVALKKTRHYIRALDVQLNVCDRTDEVIDKLCTPYPARRLGDASPRQE